MKYFTLPVVRSITAIVSDIHIFAQISPSIFSNSFKLDNGYVPAKTDIVLSMLKLFGSRIFKMFVPSL